MHNFTVNLAKINDIRKLQDATAEFDIGQKKIFERNIKSFKFANEHTPMPNECTPMQHVGFQMRPT